MKKITISAAALLAILVLLLSGTMIASANELQLHESSATTAMGSCVQCHGNKAMSKSLSASVATAHKLHMRSPTDLMYLGVCNLCHKSTDTLNDSGASVRKQVSAVKCLSCHGTFTASVPQHAGVAATSTNCLKSGCHNSEAVVRLAHTKAKAPVTAKAARIAYCSYCHGGNSSVPALYSAEETNPAIW
jgi:hypothetical protein